MTVKTTSSYFMADLGVEYSETCAGVTWEGSNLTKEEALLHWG